MKLVTFILRKLANLPQFAAVKPLNLRPQKVKCGSFTRPWLVEVEAWLYTFIKEQFVDWNEGTGASP
jgi:hypothetical protein